MHIILRGGKTGPNYAAEFVRDAGATLLKAGLPQRIMVRCHNKLTKTSLIHLQIDCSHGNSLKQHQKQAEVADNIVGVFFLLI